MKKTALLAILASVSIFANAQVPELLKDINPGSSDGVIVSNIKMIDYNGTTYFQAEDVNDNMELWKTDGTTGGTVKIKEINPTASSNPNEFFVFNNKLFFGANDGILGHELYSSDGTANGTALFKQLYDTAYASESSIPSDFFEYDGKMFVWGHEFSEDPTKDLWSSDGTIAGTNKTGVFSTLSSRTSILTTL